MRALDPRFVADVMRLGTHLDAPGNNALCEASHADRNSTRRRLIEGNLPLALAKVDAYLARRPQFQYLRDDLIGDACLSLARGVDKIVSGEIEASNITGYLSVLIQREIVDGCRTASAINIPPRRQREAVANGAPLKVPCVFNELPQHPRISAEVGADLQARDLVQSCCKYAREHQFIQLRENGCTYGEIAELLKVTVAAVYGLRRRLKRRISKKLKELQ